MIGVSGKDDDWRVDVDPARLAGWMDRNQLATGEIVEVERLAGGTQNILLRFHRGGRDFVLRRPPRHPRPGNNETMMREARVLAALASTNVPHPRLIAACDDEAVIGAAFYLMEPIEGFNLANEMPAFLAESEASRGALGTHLVDALAALGNVDYLAVGLEGFGKPRGFLDRQVGRWRSQYESYAKAPNWPGPASLPKIEGIATWLEQHRPDDFIPGIMHGDYHIANVMVDKSMPRVAAIVDWELATIGDPLLDLGWLLTSWPEPDGSNGLFDISPWPGFPTGEEIIERYRAKSARDLTHIRWYQVLAGYKFGIILEGTFVRACAGEASPAMGERLHEMATNQIMKASRLIGLP